MRPPAEQSDRDSGRPIRRHDETTEKAISRAIGEEVRRAREANGWSRGYLVAQLPSGIGDRTLLSYEHGTRHLTLLRFVEICRALGVAAPPLLNRALQRARIHLDNLVLQVDVRELVAQRDEQFLPMVLWAHNKLVKHPDGIVEVAPAAVVELADFIGCSEVELANYLARFVPDQVDSPPASESAARSQGA